MRNSYKRGVDPMVTRRMTARELKNRAGEALRHVARGGRVLVTRRGRLVAAISAARDERQTRSLSLRPFKEAWADIERRLKGTRPVFSSWRKAIGWSRRRP
jgi:prevent-host-death family protein